MSFRFFIMIALLSLCLSEDEGQHFLDSLEDLHHLGLSITDLLEIQQLANTISDQELQTLDQVLQNLSEDQVLELADKTGEELDLLFRMQGKKSKEKEKHKTKTKRSPFGLSVIASIRTQHIASQGWIPPPPPPPLPPYGFPSDYHYHNQPFTGSGSFYGGGLGPAFSHGGRYGRSTGEGEDDY